MALDHQHDLGTGRRYGVASYGERRPRAGGEVEPGTGGGVLAAGGREAALSLGQSVRITRSAVDRVQVVAEVAEVAGPAGVIAGASR